MKITQKLTRHESNSGEKCGGCGHAWSNHNVIFDLVWTPESLPAPLKLDSCLVCKCGDCDWY